MWSRRPHCLYSLASAETCTPCCGYRIQDLVWWNVYLGSMDPPPHQHVNVLQSLMLGMSKLASTPASICQVIAGKPLGPTPFLCIFNAVAELVRNIEICMQLRSLGQIFTEPTSLYVKPAPIPQTTPVKCPTSYPTSE
eukprot:15365535-Ditylum_brightwellii.AAC.1